MRRFTIACLALLALTALATPTAAATQSDCAPGTGGFGTTGGLSDGFLAAWNCAGAEYDLSGDEPEASADAVGVTVTT